MGISKKNRRKFVYNGTNFFWWIHDHLCDVHGNQLGINIATEDKKFLIRYFAYPFDPNESYILVIGENFPGMKSKKGHSIEMSCPFFSTVVKNKSVTPKAIEEILQWCFNGDEKIAREMKQKANANAGR